jgi:hypothetical protein
MWFSQLIDRQIMTQKSVLHIEDLAIVKEESVNLVIWQRPVDTDIDLFVRYLISEDFKPINQSVTVEETERVVSDYLNAPGFHSEGKIKLIHDIVNITHQFFEITSASRLRLILKIIADDACRKFHTDAYDLRLLCTYKGKATEWVEEVNVNRALLKAGNNESIVKDLRKIKCLQPFEVAVLKGEPAIRPHGGIVHRSPPIESEGERRFLFRLDF